MSDSPDTEVAFRNPDNMEDTGAQGDDDRFDDTVEDHGTYRRDRGEGDVPDIGMGALGFNRMNMDGNGRDYPTGSSYRIAIKPESYDGVEDWEEYISHFDICAELGKWRDQDKVLALAAALKGPARTFYISLSQTEKRSYHILVQRLGQRFGSTRQQNRWLSRLESRKRRQGESIAALADDLRQMAQRAYTDLDPRAQEVLAINQLYKSVSPDVKYQCTNQNCKTVSDAVEVIERYEAILGDTQEKKKSTVRMVNETIQEGIQSTSTENSYHDTLQTLTRRISELETKRPSPQDRQLTQSGTISRFNNKPDRREIRCYLCGNIGHICRNCPIFIKCKEQVSQQGTSSRTQKQNENRHTPSRQNTVVQGNFRNPLAQ